MTALNGPTAGRTSTEDTTITKDPESFFVVNIVVFVIFRLRSKLRRTTGALAQAVVNAVGAFRRDWGEFRG